MEKSRNRRRTALRFESLNDVRVSRRFLAVDVALDLLGLQLRPDDWGYARKFANLPFAYQTGAYLWHQFEKTEKGWQLTYETVSVVKEDRGEFLALKLMYSQVCRRFIEGCEQAKFEVALLDPDRGVLNFPQTTAVTSQATAIFETGHAFGPDSPLTPLPVVVDRAAFEKWLAAEAKEDGEVVERTVAALTKHKVLDAVRQFARQNEVLLESEWLWAILNTVFGRQLSRNQFNKDWKDIPSQEKGGNRPVVAMQARREAIKDDAIRVAKDAAEDRVSKAAPNP